MILQETDRHRLFSLFFPLAILSVPLHLGAVYLWSFSASVFALTLVFYLQWRRDQRSSDACIVSSGLESLIVLYLFFLALSAVQTSVPYKTVLEIFKTLAMVCVFYATLYYCSDRSGIRRLAAALAWLGGTLSFYGLLQWLGALPRFWWDKPGFLSAVYRNHNHFAGLLEVLLPISIGLSLAEENRSKKILFFFLCGLMGIAFILSLSRGGFLAMALALFFMSSMLWIQKAVKNAFWFSLVLIVGVLTASILFSLDPVLDRLVSIKNAATGGDLSMGQRILMWKGTRGLISENLWFGTGPGTFDTAFLRFRPLGFIDRPVYAHNDYLHLLADCGVFTFLAVIGLFVALIGHGFMILKKHQSPLSLGIASGCMASITAWIVHSAVDFNFHIPANWLLFTVACGMLLSIDRPKAFTSPLAITAMRLCINSACVLTLLGCVYFGVSDWFFWKGMREYKLGQNTGALKDMNWSIGLNPFNAEARYYRALILMPSIDAEEDLVQAARLDPFEPYFSYVFAKNRLRVSKSETVSSMVPYFQKAIAKDPRDPRLYYLSAEVLLSVDGPKDIQVEQAATDMLKTSIQLNPSSAFLAYKALWDYSHDFQRIKGLERMAPEGIQGLLEFLEREDLWKYYRPYYLKSLGIEADAKYRSRASIQWSDRPFGVFTLKEFEVIGPQACTVGDFYYGNGRIQKKILLKDSVYQLEIKAKGSRAGNSYPVLRIWLNDELVDVLYIDSAEFINFFSILRTNPGDHRLGIEFINDDADQTGTFKRDRNVWIRTITLRSFSEKNNSLVD